MSIDRNTYLLMAKNIYFLPSKHWQNQLSSWITLEIDRCHRILAFEVAGLECPEPEIGNFLVVKFRIAYVPVAGN